MKKTGLILDDDHNRLNWFKKGIEEQNNLSNFDLVETADECIKCLNENEYVMFFADHDLGDEVFVAETEKNTGSEVVRHIIKNKPNIDFIVVHSMNLPAADNMVDSLIDAGYNAQAIPYLILMLTPVQDTIDKIQDSLRIVGVFYFDFH